MKLTVERKPTLVVTGEKRGGLAPSNKGLAPSNKGLEPKEQVKMTRTDG